MATPEQERFLAQFRFEGPGKRVKSRVRNVMALVGLVQVLVAAVTLVFVLFCREVLCRHGVDPSREWPFLAWFLVLYVPPLVAMTIAGVLMTKLFTRLKWLSPEEGRDLKWYGSSGGFPPSCWEPHDDLQPNTPESQNQGDAKEEP